MTWFVAAATGHGHRVGPVGQGHEDHENGRNRDRAKDEVTVMTKGAEFKEGHRGRGRDFCAEENCLRRSVFLCDSWVGTQTQNPSLQAFNLTCPQPQTHRNNNARPQSVDCYRGSWAAGASFESNT